MEISITHGFHQDLATFAHGQFLTGRQHIIPVVTGLCHPQNTIIAKQDGTGAGCIYTLKITSLHTNFSNFIRLNTAAWTYPIERAVERLGGMVANAAR